jgi:cytochrome P450
MTNRSGPITAPRPPGPRGHWLLGVLPEFIKDRLGQLRHLHDTWGKVVSFRILRFHNVMVNDPALAAEVLLHRQDKFLKNRGFWVRHYDIFGQGLLTSEGADWKRNRKLAAPAFQPKTLEHYIDTIRQTTRNALDEWRLGETRDVHADLMAITADIVVAALFDTSIGNTRAITGHVHEVEAQLALRLKRPLAFTDAWPLASNRRFRHALGEIERLIAGFIAEQRQHPSAGRSLLRALMDARFDDGGGLSDKQLRDELVTIFLAGHDTTAITLGWSFFLLSQHPEYLPRLREEWRQADTPVSARDPFAGRPLTHGVIHEALRLFPPAYMFGREALEDMELGGYHIRKGEAVILSPWVLGRNPAWYPEPERFLPERWMNGLEQQLPRFAFIPFGGGPRICIGQGFALLEASIMLEEIGQRFSLHCEDPGAVVPLPSITLPPRDGLPMRVREPEQE